MPTALISGDSHVIEPITLWQDALSAEFGDRAPRVVPVHPVLGTPGPYFIPGPGGQIMEFANVDRQQAEHGLKAAGFDPAERVKFQRDADISAEIMNPTFMLAVYQSHDREVVRAAARVYNDWIISFCCTAPARLWGMAALPLEDVEWAVAELRRVRAGGLRGAIIPTSAAAGFPPYRDECYQPVWDTASELGMPVTLHVIARQAPDPLHFYSPEERATAPAGMIHLLTEVMQPLANEFIFGGILDRAPHLRLLCSEFEISWVPFFMDRVDQMQDIFSVRMRDLPTLELRASDYLRTRIWHGMIDDPHGADMIPLIGADRVLWGSDFPHIRSIGLDARPRTTELLSRLSGREQRLILHDNAATLYGEAHN